MRLRRFNNKGVDRFREYLRLAREDATASVQWDLLQDPSLTEEVNPPAEVDAISFQTKREAATYLHKLLREIPKQTVIEDQGLWTWLSLYFFDSICPKRDGKRAIRNDYTYIYEPKNTRHFYRHLFFISWRILDIAPIHNQLLLDRSVASLDKISSEIMKRLYLTRIPCFFELVEKIYRDPKTNRARKGIVDTTRINRGDLSHRLPTCIRQLEKTYDLHSLTADQLLDLLGPEFQFESGSR
jgi:hypothetical protein